MASPAQITDADIAKLDKGALTDADIAKFDAAGSQKPKLSDRAKDKAKHSLTGGLSQEERAAPPKGYSMAEMASDAYSGPLAIMGLEGAGAAGAGLVKAGGQLLKGSVGPALQAARPALGIAASFGTGAAVHKLAIAAGAPEWVAESVAAAAAGYAGERVGLSPEMRAKIKVSGVKGLIKEWIEGSGAPPKPSAVEAFWKDAHPGEPVPAPGKAFEDARAELMEYRRRAALKLREAAKSPKTTKSPKPEASAPAATASEAGATKAPAGTAPAAEDGESYIKYSKESLVKARKSLFRTTQDDLNIPNDQVRTRFAQIYGHGLSDTAMEKIGPAKVHQEIVEYEEYIAKNGKLPDAPGVK